MDTTLAGGKMIDNGLYDALGERWYAAADDPIALLRAESDLRNPWVAEIVQQHLPPDAARGPQRVLDVGCGGGFLSNFLAAKGFAVTGVDLSEASLCIARDHDATGKVCYLAADGARLPFADASFDVVCAMDFLEHVEDPMAIIKEMGRVLRPSGLLFFHTFNRNWLSGLVIIKFVEWFIKNTPPNLHVLRYFITPKELGAGCRAAGFAPPQFTGMRPKFFTKAFLNVLRTKTVGPDFGFVFTKSTLLAYCGYAVKK